MPEALKFLPNSWQGDHTAAELSSKSLMGISQVSEAPHITTINQGLLEGTCALLTWQLTEPLFLEGAGPEA